MAIYPCRNCIYTTACGESTRTKPCDGRKTKREKSFAEQLNTELAKLKAKENR